MKVAGGKEEGSPGKGFPLVAFFQRPSLLLGIFSRPQRPNPATTLQRKTQWLAPAESRRALGPKGRTCREMVSNVKCLGSLPKRRTSIKSLCASHYRASRESVAADPPVLSTPVLPPVRSKKRNRSRTGGYPGFRGSLTGRRPLRLLRRLGDALCGGVKRNPGIHRRTSA
jgi:hypothetical protein